MLTKANLPSFYIDTTNLPNTQEDYLALSACLSPLLRMGCAQAILIIMGASLAPYVRQESGLRIFFLYCVMCDECWALSMQDIQRRAQQKLGFSFWFHMGVGLSLWSMWSISTGIGALIGSSLGDMSNYGFTMALPATFIGLSVAMRPREDYRRYLPIALSFAAACLTTVYLDRIYAVGAGAVVGLTCAYVMQVLKEQRAAQQVSAAQQAAAPEPPTAPPTATSAAQPDPAPTAPQAPSAPVAPASARQE